MKTLNPHETVGDKQWLFWNQWKEGQVLEFEFVDYFNAPVIRKRGLYSVYYAIALCDIDNAGVRKDDKLILFISYKTLVTALHKLPKDLKTPCMKQYGEGKNLFIRIERINSTRIKIHHQELREPTEGQVKDADRQYAQIRREERMMQRRDRKFGR